MWDLMFKEIKMFRWPFKEKIKNYFKKIVEKKIEKRAEKIANEQGVTFKTQDELPEVKKDDPIKITSDIKPKMYKMTKEEYEKLNSNSKNIMQESMLDAGMLPVKKREYEGPAEKKVSSNHILDGNTKITKEIKDAEKFFLFDEDEEITEESEAKLMEEAKNKESILVSEYYDERKNSMSEEELEEKIKKWREEKRNDYKLKNPPYTVKSEQKIPDWLKRKEE